MSATTIEAGRAAPRPREWVDVAPWVVLLLWLVVIGAGAWYAERPAPLSQLKDAVASGRIDSIRIDPAPLPANATGFGQQVVHWHQGAFRDRTTVGLASPGQRPDASDHAVVTGRDLVPTLRALAPDLRVTRVAPDTSDTQLAGYFVPAWISLTAAALLVVGIGMLIGGPEPRFATRWAWFFVIAASPVGCVLHLLVAGPTLTLPPAGRPGRRRLRGGLALVLVALFSSVLPNWWQS